MKQTNKVFIYVENVKNGGIYLLDTKKIEKEPGLWKTYTKPSEVEEEVVVETEETAQVGDEMSRSDIKAVLTAAEVEFKGNASTESLLQLLEDNI